MHPRREAMDHPSATRLVEYATVGYQVYCGPAWDFQHVLKALQHGTHKSPLQPKALDALHKDVYEKVNKNMLK